MAAEKARALVLRTTDWSETSRIATLWTREHGKIRALAKGGRRLKSNFENALDLLNVCDIVFLRKSSGGLDLLTEAQITQRFPRLRTDLQALHTAYYVAELLADATEDYDAHPRLFDEALATLSELGAAEVPTPVRLLRFEMVLLHELGYRPVLQACALCAAAVSEAPAFSPAAGGVVCRSCRGRQRDRLPLSVAAWALLQALGEAGEAWRRPADAAVRAELRRLLGQYVTHVLGRPPRLLSYLGS